VKWEAITAETAAELESTLEAERNTDSPLANTRAYRWRECSELRYTSALD